MESFLREFEKQNFMEDIQKTFSQNILNKFFKFPPKLC